MRHAVCQRCRTQEPALCVSDQGEKKEPIVVTHHGKPYALIQPLSERDLEELAWKQLATRRLQKAWERESDALYDYL